jgi:DNA-binding transcriptional LysR family regulator
MYERLFAASGLSLDRLRALVEVGAAGSIVRAVGGDPVKQSQYSRQIKELEDFFGAELIERHGRGIRLTGGGRELARISRFFLLGLSNFQRGVLTAPQTWRVGAGATFLERFLLPELTAPGWARSGARYAVETVGDGEIEQRLHELTLDFGIVTARALSRPLQLRPLWEWRLRLAVPATLCRTARQAQEAFAARRLPLALAAREPALTELTALKGYEPRLTCGSFLEAHQAMAGGRLAALLPDYLAHDPVTQQCRWLESTALPDTPFAYALAWNPRLLRLNAHAARHRDGLIAELAEASQGESGETPLG